MKRLILFATPNLFRGVFHSHVIDFLERIKAVYDIKISLIVFGKKTLTDKEREIYNQKMKILSEFIDVNEDLLVLKNGRSLLYLPKYIIAIKKFIDKNIESESILITQNYYTSFIGSFVKMINNKIYFHADLKGVVPEEHLYYGDNKCTSFLYFVLTKTFEKIFIKKCNTLSVVSNKFADYLRDKYGKKDIIVYPSCINDKVFFIDDILKQEFRKKIGILDDKKIIVTYSGSLQKWQNPDLIFNLFKKLSKLNSNYQFLILSYDLATVNYYLEKYDVPSEIVHIRTCLPQEMNGYLNASDVSILLRKDDLINNVASPTKFLEYLATGNFLILSKNIGDFSDLVRKYNLGIITTLDADNVAREINEKFPAYKCDEAKIKKITYQYSVEENVKKLDFLK